MCHSTGLVHNLELLARYVMRCTDYFYFQDNCVSTDKFVSGIATRKSPHVVVGDPGKPMGDAATYSSQTSSVVADKSVVSDLNHFIV